MFFSLSRLLFLYVTSYLFRFLSWQDRLMMSQPVQVSTCSMWGEVGIPRLLVKSSEQRNRDLILIRYRIPQSRIALTSLLSPPFTLQLKKLNVVVLSVSFTAMFTAGPIQQEALMSSPLHTSWVELGKNLTVFTGGSQTDSLKNMWRLF